MLNYCLLAGTCREDQKAKGRERQRNYDKGYPGGGVFKAFGAQVFPFPFPPFLPPFYIVTAISLALCRLFSFKPGTFVKKAFCFCLQDPKEGKKKKKEKESAEALPEISPAFIC